MGIGANPLLNQTPPPQAYQQDPRYARTQTPEFQALVAQQKALDQQMGDYQKQSPIYQQQKDLAGKMNSYMNPGQADPSLAQSMVMPPIAQKQNFVSALQSAAQMQAANRVSSLGPNQSPGYGDVRTPEMAQVAAEYPSNPPASIGGKGGGVPAPAPIGGKGGARILDDEFDRKRPGPFPSDTQRQPDTPSGLGGKGGASMPPQQMPSGYDQGFPAYQGPSNGSGGDLGFGGGGGGQKKLTLGEVGLTFDPSGGGGGGGGAGGSMKAYAEGGDIPAAPQGLAALGRGNDTQLVHMTPREVHGLQQLAMSQGGSLTINPHTGLPEAGFLDSLLPTLAAAAAIYFTAGAAAPEILAGQAGAAGAAGAGAAGAAGTGAAGAAGAGAATAPALNGLFGLGAQSTGALAGAATGALQNRQDPLMGALRGGISGYGVGTGMGNVAQAGAADAVSTSTALPSSPGFTSEPSFNDKLAAGFNKSSIGDIASANKAPLLGIAAPAIMDSLQAPPMSFSTPSAPGQAKKYSYDPKTQQYVLLAGGGEIADAAAHMYSRKPRKTDIYAEDDPENDPEFIKKIFALVRQQGMAQGGIASLPEYAAGGKLLQGPGDGMSDSIPAVIKGARPQRAALAQGEFVVPADVVSHLGNGSTDAGAKRLYAMMDKVRHARTGNKKQGKQINPDRFLPT